jgi:peptidyl-prolyl cis-trans isomerase B (cyclophilin B)
MRRNCVLVLVALAFSAVIAPAKPLKYDPQSDSKTPRVVIETNQGRIVVELNGEKAPASVRNFMEYVDKKFYDGLTFHRVIPNFMIQGGGMMPGLKERRGFDPVKNEASNGLSNDRGTIAVARAADPHSGTSQFYINTKDNKFLDAANNKFGYCVFGRVVEGMEVVDRISTVPTHAQGGHNDVPVQDVVILSARRVPR